MDDGKSVAIYFSCSLGSGPRFKTFCFGKYVVDVFEEFISEEIKRFIMGRSTLYANQCFSFHKELMVFLAIQLFHGSHRPCQQVIYLNSQQMRACY